MVTCNTWFDHQRNDLCRLEEEKKAFQNRLEFLEKENHKKDAYLDGLAMSITSLTECLNDMEGRLCYCSEGKGKGRGVVKMEVDDGALVYESEEEGEYYLAPTTPGPVMTTLIPIAQDLKGGKVKEEIALGAEGVIPSRQIESFLRDFKQFTHNIPSGKIVGFLKICPSI